MLSDNVLIGLSVAILASVGAALIFSVLGVVFYYCIYKPIEINYLAWKVGKQTRKFKEKHGVR